MKWPCIAPPPEGCVEPGNVPTFSVVVAAYQAAATIGEALASAFAQTLQPYEVIVCDDGSTDALDDALAPFCERVVVLRQENRGEGAAKNTASGAASGEFVVILDADDVFLPERLEALGELAAARPDLDVLTTNAYLEIAGATVGAYYPHVADFPIEQQRHGVMRNDSAIFGLAAVRRARLLEAGGFDETMPTAADWELWLRLAAGGARFGLVDEPLARYRLRESSLTADKVSEWRGCVAALERALRLPTLRSDDRSVLGETRARYARLALATAAEASLRSGAPDARRLAARIAVGRGFGVRSRPKAVLAAMLPRTAGRVLTRREARTGASRLRRSLRT